MMRPVHLLLMTLTLTAGLTCFASSASAQDATTGLIPGLRISPTLAGYIGWARHYPAPAGVTRSSARFALSGGLSATMITDKSIAPFAALMVEMEPRQAVDTRTVTYFMPMAHAGMSVIGCHDEPSSWLAATFPCLKVYGIGGVRPGVPGRSPSLRLGLGASSVFVPIFAMTGSAMLPSHYEFIMEQDFAGHGMVMFRVGLGF